MYGCVRTCLSVQCVGVCISAANDRVRTHVHGFPLKTLTLLYLNAQARYRDGNFNRLLADTLYVTNNTYLNSTRVAPVS